MAKQVNRLTTSFVHQETKEGLYPDGGGLYLRISSGGAKSFVLRYMFRSRAREMGLGSLTGTSLIQARQKASEYKLLLASGQDPIDARAKVPLQAEDVERRKFQACAEQYIATHSHSWRSTKHKDQWENTLDQYVHPVMGDIDINEVTLDMVLRALEPIWLTKPETARRLRSRIELVIDWGTARGYRPNLAPRYSAA